MLSGLVEFPLGFLDDRQDARRHRSRTEQPDRNSKHLDDGAVSDEQRVRHDQHEYLREQVRRSGTSTTGVHSVGDQTNSRCEDQIDDDFDDRCRKFRALTAECGNPQGHAVHDQPNCLNRSERTRSTPNPNRLRAHTRDPSQSSTLPPMRGLLVVNPNATTTTPRAREVLINALTYQFHLETITTDHRGHAAELGARARKDRVDAVIALGGDGTANEVVNGMLGDEGPGADVPAFGIVPGGSANVFSRSLGFPQDPIESTGELISALRAHRTRRIGLGRANNRWFLCNAGLGIDAEIIKAMEAARAKGKSATPTRYLMTTLRQFFSGTDRRTSSMVLLRPGHDPVRRVFLAIVQNTSPWTYLGAIPVNPSPDASFDTGLDMWALRSMSVASGLINSRRMLMNKRAPNSDSVLSLHDQDEFTIVCLRPTALQVDGEGLGDIDEIRFTAHRNALRVFV